MRKILSVLRAGDANSVGLLILRLGLGILTMHHGYQKLSHFGAMKIDFLNFLGLGSSVSLAVAMSVELLGSIFIILGLFTRITAVPLITTISVALFKVKEGDVFGGGEPAALFLLGYLYLLVAGPGSLSIDGIFAERTRG